MDRISEATALFELYTGSYVDIVMKLNDYIVDDEEEEDGTQLAMLKVLSSLYILMFDYVVVASGQILGQRKF